MRLQNVYETYVAIDCEKQGEIDIVTVDFGEVVLDQVVIFRGGGMLCWALGSILVPSTPYKRQVWMVKKCVNIGGSGSAPGHGQQLLIITIIITP